MTKAEAVRWYHSGVGPTVARLLEQAEALVNAQQTIDRLQKALSGAGRFCAGCFEKQQSIDRLQEEAGQSRRAGRSSIIGSGAMRKDFLVRARRRRNVR